MDGIGRRIAVSIGLTALTVLFVCHSGALAASTGPELLQKLVISKERPKGYEREKFNHWTTVPGESCDARDYVLYRQNRMRPRSCGDLRGRWFSKYDGKVVRVASKLDIDHMVPLAEAWASGARVWKPLEREAFANDLYAFALMAVTLSSNRSKGDSDPAEWLPPRKGFICRYTAQWTAVKYRWRLSIDSRERSAIREQFESCPRPALQLPTIKRVDVPSAPGGGGGDENDPQFESCSDAIAAGYGPYVKGVDAEYWWYEDRDGDGTVCE